MGFGSLHDRFGSRNGLEEVKVESCAPSLQDEDAREQGRIIAAEVGEDP